MNPRGYHYSREHEWVKVESDGTALVGVTQFAQEQLGDVVYLDLPGAGKQVQQFKKLGEVESVKAVSDLYAPVGGEVVALNQDVVAHPEMVNKDPYGKGWLLRLKVNNPSELQNLLSAEAYEAFLATAQKKG